MDFQDTAFDLIGRSLTDNIPLPEGVELQTGTCCVTGRLDFTIPRAAVLDKSFNKHDFLRAPNSDQIGVNAWRTLQCKDERMACWVFYDGKLHTVGDTTKGKDLSRDQARKMTLGITQPDAPWCGYWSVSFHKHGAFYSPVNFSRWNNVWGFEDHPVDCSNIELVQRLFNTMMELKVAGVLEYELKTLIFVPKTVTKIGIPTLEKYRSELDSWYRSRVYALLLYLLYSAKEIKEMGKEALDRWPLRSV